MNKPFFGFPCRVCRELTVKNAGPNYPENLDQIQNRLCDHCYDVLLLDRQRCADALAVIGTPSDQIENRSRAMAATGLPRT